MGSNKFLRLLFVMIAMCCVFVSSSHAYKFYIGGKHGWVVKPSEDYNHWAERNRFQVNDTLYFKYKKGSDSVLVVKEEDYESCNTKNPMKRMDDGDSSFQVDKSGPFYFISGDVDHCRQGQRIIVVVMAVRPKHQPPSAAPVPSPPAHSPPARSPPAAEPSEDSSSSKAPAPSPSENSNHSGSRRVGGSVNVAVGVSIGAILIIFFNGFGRVV